MVSGSPLERKLVQYGGRGHGKTITGRWPRQNMATFQNSGDWSDLRRDGKMEKSTDTFLYPTRMMEEMEKVPTNTMQDRLYLNLTKREYDNFADCIQQGCYMNKFGSFVKLKNCKTKKLKNMVYKIKKNSLLLQSMIWKAQLQVIERELQRRHS